MSHRARSVAGGKRNGEARRKEQAKKWSDDGLSIAKRFVAQNPRYSRDTLATEIKFKLDDIAPTHGQIKNVISGWQKSGSIPEPNRKNQVKHASPAK
jgi:hypothetical protein